MTASTTKSIPDRWETRQRLLFIESRLYWTGRINRGDIIGYFGISMPQASADLTLYQEMAPGNAVYDKSGKTYRTGTPFRPLFLDPALDQFLGHHMLEDGFLGDAPDLVRMPAPQRPVAPTIMRQLLIVIREEQAIRIRYQSMSRPRPAWRWISPHAFGHDGYRWHVRAWCAERKSFRDFVLGRIDRIGEARQSDMAHDADSEWHEWVEVRYGPHPDLTGTQAKVIERDYGMRRGIGTIKVQKAMLFYVLTHLRLDSDNYRPPSTHIRLLNPEIRELLMR